MVLYYYGVFQMNKAKLNLFSLYWESVKDQFSFKQESLVLIFNSLKHPVAVSEVLIKMFHVILLLSWIALLPVILTITAGINSIFSLFTRKPLYNTEIDAVCRKLTTMDGEHIQSCVDLIVSEPINYLYIPNELKNELKDDNGKPLIHVNLSFSSYLLRKQLTESANHQEMINGNDLKLSQEQNRTKLLTFFKAPQNAGKHMQHRIQFAVDTVDAKECYSHPI